MKETPHRRSGEICLDDIINLQKKGSVCSSAVFWFINDTQCSIHIKMIKATMLYKKKTAIYPVKISTVTAACRCWWWKMVGISYSRRVRWSWERLGNTIWWDISKTGRLLVDFMKVTLVKLVQTLTSSGLDLLFSVMLNITHVFLSN